MPPWHPREGWGRSFWGRSSSGLPDLLQTRASTGSAHLDQVPLSLGKFLKRGYPQTGKVGRRDPDMGVRKSGFLSWAHHTLLSNLGTQGTANQVSRMKSPPTGTDPAEL